MYARELDAVVERSTFKGTALFCVDWVLYLVLLGCVVWTDVLWLKWALGGLTGLTIGFLFLIGHDACHNSLTSSRRLNAILGRLAFLPSLHPYSLWELGHNRIHHVYTNLKGRDYVWAPLSVAEYRSATSRTRRMYRFYRTPVGCLLYFLIEIWTRKMFFFEWGVKERRPIYYRDRWLVIAFLLAQIGVVFGLDRWLRGGGSPGHDLALAGSALVFPFVAWNFLASLLPRAVRISPADFAPVIGTSRAAGRPGTADMRPGPGFRSPSGC